MIELPEGFEPLTRENLPDLLEALNRHVPKDTFITTDEADEVYKNLIEKVKNAS